jgi:hypothetical protein
MILAVVFAWLLVGHCKDLYYKPKDEDIFDESFKAFVRQIYPVEMRIIFFSWLLASHLMYLAQESKALYNFTQEFIYNQ